MTRVPGMSYMGLKNAVSHIHQDCAGAHKDNGSSPFLFLVGAGISYPSVPLASQIEKECRAKAAEYGRIEEPASTSPMETYSHWLEQAFPQAEQRRRYFEDKIKDKQITSANMHLARLLLDGRVSRLVVTPNFDDFISRSLRLFGKQFIIEFDHPDIVERIDVARAEPQIIHVHGSYLFYDCLNLSREIRTRGRRGGMKLALEQVFEDRYPLVLGYSGWPEDVIMKTLWRRLRSNKTLAHNIYWFCHTQQVVDQLPDWLKRHGNVRLVVPNSTNSQDVDGRLDATTVLDELMQVLDLSTPPLMTDPLGFFSDSLHSAFGESASNRENRYRAENVIRRLDSARSRQMDDPLVLLGRELTDEDARQLADICSELQAALQELRSTNQPLQPLLARARQAIRAIMDMSTGLDVTVAFTYAADFFLCYRGLLQANNQPRLFELEIWGAEMLWRKGVALGQLGNDREARLAFKQVEELFIDSSFPGLFRVVAQALINMAKLPSPRTESNSIEDTDNHIEKEDYAINIYEQIHRFFGERPELEVQVQVAKSLINKAERQHDLENDVDAMASYNTVVSRYGHSSYPQLQVEVAKAMLGKSALLYEQGRSVPESEQQQRIFQEALEVNTSVQERYREASDPALRVQVAKSLVDRATLIRWYQQVKIVSDGHEDVTKRIVFEADLAILTEVMELYGSSTDPLLQVQVAIAMMHRVELLNQSGHVDDALAACDDVVLRYGGSLHRLIQAQVVAALLKRGELLEQLDEAINNASKGYQVQALKCYEAVVERYSVISELQDQANVAAVGYARLREAMKATRQNSMSA